MVEVKGIQIGLFHFRGKFYAYEDVCAHQGGPACEGLIFEDLANIACPWHGVEYNIENGVGRADKKMKLRRFKVVLKKGIVMLKV